MAKFDMAAHVRRINSQDKIATGILTAIVGLVLLILAAIVFYILVAGAGKLFDVSFLTSKPQQFKAGGGIGPELFNSFYLLFLTLVISVPLSLGAAIYLSQYAPENWVTNVAKTIIETLSSLPSIVVGLFGFLFFVLTMGWGFSVIAGAVALTMFNIPILVRTCQQALEDVPRSQRDAGLAMGLTRWGDHDPRIAARRDARHRHRHRAFRRPCVRRGCSAHLHRRSERAGARLHVLRPLESVVPVEHLSPRRDARGPYLEDQLRRRRARS